MDHVQAMARATRIARFLVSGSETTGRRPVREQSLIGTLAVRPAVEQEHSLRKSRRSSCSAQRLVENPWSTT